MEAFLICLGAFAFVGLLFGLFWLWVEHDSRLAFAGAILVLFLGLWGLINGALQSEEDPRPCLRHTTTYVMSGKVLVPITTCAERGEVVQ